MTFLPTTHRGSQWAYLLAFLDKKQLLMLYFLVSFSFLEKTHYRIKHVTYFSTESWSRISLTVLKQYWKLFAVLKCRQRWLKSKLRSYLF